MKILLIEDDRKGYTWKRIHMEKKNKKIIYVEDDLSLIEGLKYTLEKNGFLVDKPVP